MTKIRTGLRLALLSLLVPSFASAQIQSATNPSRASETDPANLKGEQVAPRTGLELPIDQGAAGLWQTLLKLRTRASLMMIVAHPDDEDGGMLTYEVRGQGVRAAMMTLTRGEGGQNLMTGDFNDALGLIRTQELLAADRFFGTTQMFGTEVDFGFSKTKEESLAQWTHERVLYDAVRAVRLYRPLVITSVFVGGPTDGHGHHQVAGEMAQEVFTAAADPKVFPEMGLEPWAPLKVYARAPFARIDKQGMFDYATGQYVPLRFYNYVTKAWSDAVPHADVIIREGEYSDKLGMTYVQFAREGLALQKSQIGSGIRVPPAGAYDVSYTRYGTRIVGADTKEPEKSFFDGIDVSITGIATLAPHAPASLRTGLVNFQSQVEAIVQQYDAAHPNFVAPALATAAHSLDAILDAVPAMKLPSPENVDLLHELRIKRVQLNNALVLALGLSLDAKSDKAEALESSALSITTSFTRDGSGDLPGAEQYLQNAGGIMLGKHVPPQAHAGDPADFSSIVTRPYFSRDNIEQPFYNVKNAALRNAPSSPPAVTAWASLNYNGVKVTLGRVVHHDAQPLSIVPEINVSLDAHAQVLPNGENQFIVWTRDHSLGTEPHFLGICLPTGCSSQPANDNFSPATGAFSVDVPAALRKAPFDLTVFSADGKRGEAKMQPNDVEGFRPTGYPGLTYTNYFTQAKAHIVPLTVVVTPGIPIAYLPGTGDDVQSQLKNLNIEAATITVADIHAGKLAKFSTLIIGPRAYTSDRDLAAANPAILEFAKNGGTVIVQYQAHAFSSSDAPFPIELDGDGDRVVEELARVTLTPTPSRVLDYPNKLTAADFDGWVEERGHGFPASWDAHYEAPTETHDSGQAPQRGGLLVARYGKGYYVYTAFALYRQLPEAVPGAYRLFANLLSLGHQPAK